MIDQRLARQHPQLSTTHKRRDKNDSPVSQYIHKSGNMIRFPNFTLMHTDLFKFILLRLLSLSQLASTLFSFVSHSESWFGTAGSIQFSSISFILKSDWDPKPSFTPKVRLVGWTRCLFNSCVRLLNSTCFSSSSFSTQIFLTSLFFLQKLRSIGSTRPCFSIDELDLYRVQLVCLRFFRRPFFSSKIDFLFFHLISTG